MEDPVLNRNLEETKELQTRWSQFHDFCLMAQQQGPAKITAQAEMKFLELKSRIAMLHDGFMSGLKNETKAGQNIMQIVSDVILLKRAANYSDAERQKFEFDWNDAYMLLTEQTGALDEEKKRLAGISKRAYDMAKRTEIMKAQVYKFFHSDQLRWAITAIILFMVFFGIPYFGIYNYREFGKIRMTKPIYTKFVNTVYRPYLAKDYEYNDMDEVEVDPTAVPGARISAKPDGDKTIEYFLNTVVPQIGFGPADYAEVKTMLDRRMGFGVEWWEAESKDVAIYWILFQTSADASRFIELDRQNIAKLTAAQKKLVWDRTFAVRRANFVAVGFSEHVTRFFYTIAKFKFKEGTPSELDK